MAKLPVCGADILLPANGVDMGRWSVVAVDQFTSERAYWEETERIAGDAPSALRLVLPEAFLDEEDTRLSAMQDAMRAYMNGGVLERKVEDGFVLVERVTESGARIGLMTCVDLEAYDPMKGSTSLIRATEGTVVERVPPRMKIRQGAAIELPHVLMLLDDPDGIVIEPLYAQRDALNVLYDFELMQNGGHLRGWRVDGAQAASVLSALCALMDGCEGLLLAVGDGNHSLAAAKGCWEELRGGLSPEERENHPARFALVELVNLHCDAIRFEPIHRIVTGVDPDALMVEFERYAEGKSGEALTVIVGGEERACDLSLRELQLFLDAYLRAHPGAGIDYIHGEESLRRLCRAPGTVGFMPEGLRKDALFPFIRKYGVLPRKTFSMGHANEKRYYTEVRKIEK